MTVAMYVFTVLSFTAIVIFAVKYISQAITGRAQIASDDAYRKLASDAVTAQSGNAATLSAIQSELAEIKTRMASVETILKQVE
jgi:Tfp pilus assembly protein PilO